MALEPVQIIGLREFLAELRTVDSTLPRQIGKASKAAADLAASRTRASFSARSGVAPKVADSVRSSGLQRAAYVQIGGDAYPFALGSEFGSVRFKQFPSYRGSGGDAGYSLYPSVRASREEIVAIYGDSVIDALRRAFPN